MAGSPLLTLSGRCVRHTGKARVAFPSIWFFAASGRPRPLALRRSFSLLDPCV